MDSNIRGFFLFADFWIRVRSIFTLRTSNLQTKSTKKAPPKFATLHLFQTYNHHHDCSYGPLSGHQDRLRSKERFTLYRPKTFRPSHRATHLLNLQWSTHRQQLFPNSPRSPRRFPCNPSRQDGLLDSACRWLPGPSRPRCEEQGRKTCCLSRTPEEARGARCEPTDLQYLRLPSALTAQLREERGESEGKLRSGWSKLLDGSHLHFTTSYVTMLVARDELVSVKE